MSVVVVTLLVVILPSPLLSSTMDNSTLQLLISNHLTQSGRLQLSP